MIIDDTALISDLINRISEYMETQRSYNQNVVEEAFAMKEISARIESSLREHRETTKNIGEAIVKISSVGSENSSATEEIAASTEEIASIAESLQRMVDGFEYRT
jgi:methyl-accepting chemotaxis protein